VKLADQVDEFLTDKRRKAPATRDQYAFVLERILLPWASKHEVTEAPQITDKALNRFTDHLLERRTEKGKPLSPATLQTYIRSVRIFLAWEDVPKGHYEPPRRPQRLREVLTREEVDRLERAAGDERDRLVVRLLADTGIRVSELLGLRPPDLRENSHDKQAFIRVVGKGDREREVAVPMATFRRVKVFADWLDEPTAYIFQGKRRRPRGEVERLTRSGVDQLIHNLAAKAEIPKRVYPHLFRHSYATLMVNKGVNLVLIQKALGHSTLAMVSQVYSHSTAPDSYKALTEALK
jgi:integrase/recombinase XerD